MMETQKQHHNVLNALQKFRPTHCSRCCQRLARILTVIMLPTIRCQHCVRPRAWSLDSPMKALHGGLTPGEGQQIESRKQKQKQKQFY